MAESPAKRNNVKKIVKKFPGTTIRLTLVALRWIFLLILIYVVISIIILVLTERFDFLIQIVTFGISGFFAFFMGYFGWMFANSIMEWLIGVEQQEEENVPFENKRTL